MKRYIDAEKLSEEISNTYREGDSPYSYLSDETEDTLIGKFQVLDIIFDQPTADVEEVRHGEWIVRQRREHYPSGKAYEECVCPYCKRADHNGDGIYCGYCGAKMDGNK